SVPLEIFMDNSLFNVNFLLGGFFTSKIVFASYDLKFADSQDTVCSSQNITFIQNRATANMIVLENRWNTPTNRHLVRKFTRFGILTISDSGLQAERCGQGCCRKLKKLFIYFLAVLENINNIRARLQIFVYIETKIELTLHISKQDSKRLDFR
ncbi:hypothetical protein X777_04861, partial [Ooceraea biroi]